MQGGKSTTCTPRSSQSFRPYRHAIAVDRDARGLTVSEDLDAYQAGLASTVLIIHNDEYPSTPPCHQVYATYRFPFDAVYDEHATQEDVYVTSARPAVLSTLQGYNATIIAYGQTGTGKTHTMEGPSLTGPHRGIIPRAVDDIFASIENDGTPHSRYLVRASYLQIYNEVISDLLRADRTNLVVREDRRRGVYVDGLSEWVVRSPAEVFQLMEAYVGHVVCVCV